MNLEYNLISIIKAILINHYTFKFLKIEANVILAFCTQSIYIPNH